MAKKTINSYGTATQMVGDINDNFNELYNKIDGGSGQKSSTETITLSGLYSSNKKMASSNGKLTFADSTSGRKIFVMDVSDAAGKYAFLFAGVQSDNSALGYAVVDSESNIIGSVVGKTTAGDKTCFIPLKEASKIYISRPSSATSASVQVFALGDDLSNNEIQANIGEGNHITVLGGFQITKDGNDNFGLTANQYVNTVIADVHGAKTIEGYGYTRQNLYNWAILDEDLKVIAYEQYGSYYDCTTPYRHLPDGAKFLAFAEKINISTPYSKYFLRTELPEKEYTILALGNSYTQCYWTYVPAILEELYGDKVKCTIVVGMLGASAFGGWEDFITDGTVSRSMSVSVHGLWKGYLSSTAASLFSKFDFDLVGFQQQSGQAKTYAWGSDWPLAVASASERAQRHIDFMWTMVHAKPEGNDLAYTDTLMRQIFTAHQSFAAAFPIEICPVGTAIQNARHTSINDLEWAGSAPGLMTPDGTHLQDGFACYIAALVVARYIGKKLGFDFPLYGDKLDPDAEFDAAYSKLTVYGTSPVYSTGDSMLYLAQRCVESAIKFPFEIKNVATGATITT